MTKFNLSKKVVNLEREYIRLEWHRYFFTRKDVKEFIKILKEEIPCGCEGEVCKEVDRKIIKIIDKLAGDKFK